MCIIAGYAGNKPAAPILIEMLKKTEYIDGGLSTGIATIHEGKLYMRKVIGDVDTLLRETDALSLPGTTGIIHSRTGGNHVEHAHPFTSEDGKYALVLNGTGWGTGTEERARLETEILNGFLDKGITIKSAVIPPDENTKPYNILKNGMCYHRTEKYVHMIGEALRDLPMEEIRYNLAKETKKALETVPADVIILGVHAALPDTVTVGTVSRPMSIGIGDGETFMCTVPLGLPESIQKSSVIFLPPTTVADVTPDGVCIRSTSLEGTKVEQIDFRTARLIREDMEKRLKVGEENAISIYGFPFYTEWDAFWKRPLVESKFVLENSRLKPAASAIYEGLWSFHKEGRLRFKLAERESAKGEKKKAVLFWLER